MHTYNLRCEMLVHRPIAEVFAFFEDPRNLARITPDALQFRLVTKAPLVMRAGLEIDYTIRMMGLRMKWRSLIKEYEPPFRFVDEQVKGPYRYWHHRHEFWEEGNSTRVIDSVFYALAFDPLSRIVHAGIVRGQLRTIFHYRQEALSRIFDGRTVPVLEPVIAAT